jgi:hypothetical protein
VLKSEEFVVLGIVDTTVLVEIEAEMELKMLTMAVPEPNWINPSVEIDVEKGKAVRDPLVSDSVIVELGFETVQGIDSPEVIGSDWELKDEFDALYAVGVTEGPAVEFLNGGVGAETGEAAVEVKSAEIAKVLF